MDRTLAWDILAWLRDIWRGPLVLKGVLHADDARLAVQHGVDGLIDSSHGGRQLDASPSAISALPHVVDAVRSAIPVLMDGGVRRGHDTAKAIALGANAVLLDRPLLYGLTVRGEAGVDAVLKLFGDDLLRTMMLLGARNVADVGHCQCRPGLTKRRRYSPNTAASKRASSSASVPRLRKCRSAFPYQYSASSRSPS